MAFSVLLRIDIDMEERYDGITPKQPRVHYDREKMEFTGLTHDNRLIKPVVTYSQTHYESESRKEKVISRVQDKVIANEPDLLRHLSNTFDLIVAMDTNTKVICR